MTRPGLHDKILCYLTAEADTAVREMVEAGFDRDLAISVLESIWPEEKVFEVPAPEPLDHE